MCVIDFRLHLINRMDLNVFLKLYFFFCDYDYVLLKERVYLCFILDSSLYIQNLRYVLANFLNPSRNASLRRGRLYWLIVAHESHHITTCMYVICMQVVPVLINSNNNCETGHKNVYVVFAFKRLCKVILCLIKLV